MNAVVCSNTQQFTNRIDIFLVPKTALIIKDYRSEMTVTRSARICLYLTMIITTIIGDASGFF